MKEVGDLKMTKNEIIELIKKIEVLESEALRKFKIEYSAIDSGFSDFDSILSFFKKTKSVQYNEKRITIAAKKNDRLCKLSKLLNDVRNDLALAEIYIDEIKEAKEIKNFDDVEIPIFKIEG